MNVNTPGVKNRFDDFFKESNYVALKNGLYNYRLRRRSVSRYLHRQQTRTILETGSGLSPVSNKTGQTVYTDLSFEALMVLKRFNPGGRYVAADCCRLPFKSNVFSHAISSEVLEHIPDDRAAVKEMARVVTQAGELVITFPHRKCYFARDDRYVKHYRRYEIEEMERLLKNSGFRIVEMEKVLGPIEKAVMLAAVFIYEILRKNSRPGNQNVSPRLRYFLEKAFRWINTLVMAPVWLEARSLPVAFAAVLMIVGRRKTR